MDVCMCVHMDAAGVGCMCVQVGAQIYTKWQLCNNRCINIMTHHTEQNQNKSLFNYMFIIKQMMRCHRECVWFVLCVVWGGRSGVGCGCVCTVCGVSMLVNIIVNVCLQMGCIIDHMIAIVVLSAHIYKRCIHKRTWDHIYACISKYAHRCMHMR